MARVLLNTTLLSFLGPHFIFDGVSLGWSPTELIPVGASKSTSFSLGQRRDDKPNEVEIAIRNSGTLNIGALVHYLRDGSKGMNPMGDPNLEPLLKWLNALFRSQPEKTMICRPNSNAFFRRDVSTSAVLRSTGGVLEALRGKYYRYSLLGKPNI
jgi:hypothetical protein